MITWLSKRKKLLFCCILVAAILALLNVQVGTRPPTSASGLSLGTGDSVVITLGDALAAGAVDYTFDGTDDNVEFQTALNALPLTGGRLVVVSAVQINFSAGMAATGVTRPIDNVTIEGVGRGTYFARNNTNYLFTAGGNNWVFTNLRTDVGSIDMGATTGWMQTNVQLGATYYAYRSPYGQSAFNGATVASLTDSGLTNGRIPYAGAGGLLSDSAGLQWSGTYIGSPVGRTATFTVAASDAPAIWKAQADYLCDGADDQAQILAALAAGTHPYIQLSPGHFVVSAVIDIPEGCTVAGSGKDSTIVSMNAGALTTCFQAVGTVGTPIYYVTIKDLYINNTANLNTGVRLVYNRGSLVENVVIASPTYGFYITSDISSRIEDCKVINATSYATHVGSSNATRFHACTISGTDAITVVYLTGNTNATFDSCVIQGSGTTNFCFYAATNNLNCAVENCYLASVDTAGVYFKASSGNENKGNIIRANYIGDISGCSYGVWFDQDNWYNIVADNYFKGMNRAVAVENTRNYYNMVHSNVDTATNISADSMTNDQGVFTAKEVVTYLDTRAASSVFVRSNEDLSAVIPINFTISAQPDVPRTITWSFDSHNNITAFTIAIVGIDAQGFSRTVSITQASGWSGETSYAFATITSITMSARTGTGVGDTMDIGIGSKLGLPNAIWGTGEAGIYKVTKNNTDYPATSYVGDSTYGTIDMSGGGAIIDGDDFTVWYRINNNIRS